MKLYLQCALLVGVLLTIGLCEDAHETAPGGHNDEHAIADPEETEMEDDGLSHGDEDVPTAEGAEDIGEQDEEGEFPEGDEEAGEDWNTPLTSEQALALHKKIDANSNGKVSLAEINDFAHKMRRKIAQMDLDYVMKDKDSNKDGKLTFQEFMGDASKHPEETQNEKSIEFKELDTNSDKFVDADELTMMFQHHTNEKTEAMLTAQAMKDKDTDKNGVLTMKEFYAHHNVEPDEGEPGEVEIPEEDKEVFKALDIDGSGTLTLKELKAWESGAYHAESAVKKLFAHADKDKDNQVTADELDAAREEIATHEDSEAHMYLQMWTEERHENEL